MILYHMGGVQGWGWTQTWDSSVYSIYIRYYLEACMHRGRGIYKNKKIPQ